MNGDYEDVEEQPKNTGRCVVAIPTATEPIHHLGDVSEPKHMTMVWLGKPEDNPDLDMDAVRRRSRRSPSSPGPLTGLVESTGPARRRRRHGLRSCAATGSTRSATCCWPAPTSPRASARSSSSPTSPRTSPSATISTNR